MIFKKVVQFPARGVWVKSCVCLDTHGGLWSSDDNGTVTKVDQPEFSLGEHIIDISFGWCLVALTNKNRLFYYDPVYGDWNLAAQVEEDDCCDPVLPEACTPCEKGGN